jgi:cytochrome c553
LGGVQATAYLAEVPFEDAANTTSSTAGPSATSQVSCITCHRAHATSAPDAGRWDFSVTLLHEDGVESGSYQIPDPYGDLNQRSLCNKCHNKDEFDHNPF